MSKLRHIFLLLMLSFSVLNQKTIKKMKNILIWKICQILEIIILGYFFNVRLLLGYFWRFISAWSLSLIWQHWGESVTSSWSAREKLMHHCSSPPPLTRLQKNKNRPFSCGVEADESAGHQKTVLMRDWGSLYAIKPTFTQKCDYVIGMFLRRALGESAFHKTNFQKYFNLFQISRVRFSL